MGTGFYSYEIISKASSAELELAVNAKLKSGYVPIGGVTIMHLVATDFLFYQAVAKPGFKKPECPVKKYPVKGIPTAE